MGVFYMENNNIFDELKQDVANSKDVVKTKFADEKLGSISNLLKEMGKNQVEINQLTEQLKKLEKRQSEIGGISIPELFDELGLTEVKLSDGTKVRVETIYVASISEDKKSAVFNWLSKNKFDGIISHKVVTKLKKGDEKIHKKLIESLKTLKVSFKDDKNVHPATLKAFVNEQMEKDPKNFPQDIFGVFKLRRTMSS
jgi:hypothetical protein